MAAGDLWGEIPGLDSGYMDRPHEILNHSRDKDLGLWSATGPILRDDAWFRNSERFDCTSEIDRRGRK